MGLNQSGNVPAAEDISQQQRSSRRSDRNLSDLGGSCLNFLLVNLISGIFGFLTYIWDSSRTTSTFSQQRSICYSGWIQNSPGWTRPPGRPGSWTNFRSRKCEIPPEGCLRQEVHVSSGLGISPQVLLLSPDDVAWRGGEGQKRRRR